MRLSATTCMLSHSGFVPPGCWPYHRNLASVLEVCCSQGNGGYSSGDDSPSRQTSSSYSRPSMPQDSQRPPLSPATTYSPAHPSGRMGSTGGGDESHLVDDMCTPGGLRAQPDREDLRLFVENAASLNGTTVAELLQAKMVCMQVILCVGDRFEMPWLLCVQPVGRQHTLKCRAG